MSDKKYPSNLYLESVTTSVDFASHVSVEAVIVMAKELLALRKGREIPEGWKLVPVEPTPEMCETRHVGVDPYTGMATDGEYYSIGDQDAAKLYRAMLAAAPEVE